jgi:HSP20 family protein
MANSNVSSGSSANPSQSSGGQSKSGQRDLARRQDNEGISRMNQLPYFPSPVQFLANPFSAMRRMQDDMDRMFAQALGGGLMSAGETGDTGSGLATWSPAIEVKERGNELVVCAELPGLKPEDVHVEMNEDALVIHGERRQEQSSDEGGVHRTERRYGQFYRAIPLPDGANGEQAKAAFNNGVLEVTVPLPEKRSHTRQIPITGASGQQSQSSGSSEHSQSGSSQKSESGSTSQPSGSSSGRK